MIQHVTALSELLEGPNGNNSRPTLDCSQTPTEDLCDINVDVLAHPQAKLLTPVDCFINQTICSLAGVGMGYGLEPLAHVGLILPCRFALAPDSLVVSEEDLIQLRLDILGQLVC